ncbi:hypothetical protein GCE9029_00179 [Grimontia celer]|uniref:Uncharacterized protein n=1 Tax=Grimontia celer TaxID=1796497 RepID=A0A128ES44_9GAMM|nr:hypothetical protein [Grimontia celer]CZF77397.1 hypothetical protein GCE9029_00179 [Grimontia celer]
MQQVKNLNELSLNLDNIDTLIASLNECTFKVADETHEGGSYKITKNAHEAAIVEKVEAEH